jgi:hypothetical protein
MAIRGYRRARDHVEKVGAVVARMANRIESETGGDQFRVASCARRHESNFELRPKPSAIDLFDLESSPVTGDQTGT